MDLIRDKKLIFYLFDRDSKVLDVSTVKGRVMVGYKDETQSSKKIRTENDYMWIPLGKNNLENIQYARIKVKFDSTKMDVLFGEKIENHGHHH